VPFAAVTTVVLLVAWVQSPPLPSAAAASHRSAPTAHRTGAAHRAPAGLRPLATPTTTRPLRVLVIGDSLGIDLADQLVPTLQAGGVMRVTSDARGDTGLARPDYFDWPAELQTRLRADHPQVLVVLLGANDDQNLLVAGQPVLVGTAAWQAAYAQRVAVVADEAAAAGTRVVWVGLPPMAPPRLNAAAQMINGLFAGAATGRHGFVYLASWPLLATAGGQYQPAATTSQGTVTLRTADGVHLTPAGAGTVARAVAAAVARWLPAPTAAR